jgi:cysteinyl-tRNA synthetase
MNNDFNTANAITSLLSQVKVLNQVTRQKDNAAIADSIASVEMMAEVLGLELPKIKFNNEDRTTYHNWVAARKEKDFESADKYRALLEERGLL